LRGDFDKKKNGRLIRKSGTDISELTEKIYLLSNR
jgi:hypothetical protein